MRQHIIRCKQYSTVTILHNRTEQPSPKYKYYIILLYYCERPVLITLVSAVVLKRNCLLGLMTITHYRTFLITIAFVFERQNTRRDLSFKTHLMIMLAYMNSEAAIMPCCPTHCCALKPCPHWRL